MNRFFNKIKRLLSAITNAKSEIIKFPIKNFFVLVIFSILLVTVWVYPTFVHEPVQNRLSQKELLDVINDTRRTLAQILGIFGGIILLYLNWKRNEISQEEQITERFTKAIDQLSAKDQQGNRVLEVRLGGIYALERIARDSKKDHETIMEVLTAYIRENAPFTKIEFDQIRKIEHNGEPPEFSVMFKTDLQAILTVIGRRNVKHEKAGIRIINLDSSNLHGADLSKSNLRWATIRSANLRGANLRNSNLSAGYFDFSNLQNVFLWDADCRQASFVEANMQYLCAIRVDFEDTFLVSANFRNALAKNSNFKLSRLMRTNFTNADLEESNFENTIIENTNFENAILFKANFRGVTFNKVNFRDAILAETDLSETKGLTIDDLCKAKTLHKVKLNNELYNEAISSFPNLFEKRPDSIYGKRYFGVPWKQGG